MNDDKGYDAYSAEENGIIEYAARNNFRYAAWGSKHESYRIYFDNNLEYLYNGSERISKRVVERIARRSS